MTVTYRVPRLGDDGKLPSKFLPPVDLTAKQDKATLAADTAAHVADGSALATALGAAFVRPSSIGSRMRSAAARAEARNAIDLGPLASPPTVTQTTTQDGTLTKQVATISNNGVASFTFRGGLKYVFAGIYYRMASVTVTSGGNIDATHSNAGSAVEFWTDAPKIQLAVAGSGNDSRGFQIEINGQPVAATSTAWGFTSGYFVTLDFAGVRAPRKIRWESASASGAFAGVYVTQVDSVWPAEQGIRCAAVGDSVMAQTGASLPNGGFASVMGKLLGWSDVWNIGIGSTGFTASAATGGVFGSASRVADAVAAAPDVLFMPASQNDSGATASAITTAALAAFRAYRAALPGVPIISGGLNPSATGPSAAVLANEDAVKAAFDQFADPLSFWVPVSRASDTGVAQPWIYGTGFQGTTNNTGNSDVLIGPDGAHPTQPGHTYLGRRWAQAIRRNILHAPTLV